MSLPRKILITGAARGIGGATARHLLELGCEVLLVDRDAARLQTTCSELEDAHAGRVFSHVLDLADSQAVSSLGDHPWLADGLDGLVNNAAVEFLEPFEKFTPNQLETTWRVNMLAPVLLMQACLPSLAKRRGSIVNISSVATRRPWPKYSLYAASKAFLDCFARHVATEVGARGVRVNTLSPGGVQTEMMDEINARQGISEETIRGFTAKIPAEARWARPEEIAESVAFLLFGPRYLHGENLCIDGCVYQ